MSKVTIELPKEAEIMGLIYTIGGTPHITTNIVWDNEECETDMRGEDNE